MLEFVCTILSVVDEPISKAPQSVSLVFILFLVCFIFSSQILSRRGKMVSSMLNGLFRENDRKSIFFEAAGNDLYSKLFLCIQCIILLSVFAFCTLSHSEKALIQSPVQTFLFLGGSFLLFSAFFIYKRVSYYIAGKVVFSKDAVNQWNENYMSLICISGILLFFPVLLMFYVDKFFYFSYYFIIFYFFIVGFVIIYKTYLLFFRRRGLLLYLFLYLCAQEIIPLFFLYKGLVYLFNLVQKDVLWL